jgi:hypothetical protein
MSKSEPWADCFGTPGVDTKLAEAHLRRVFRRVQRMAGQGAQPTGVYAEVAEVQDRTRQQTELARQINEALHVRNMPLAQELIEDGAEMFGHIAMVAAVEMQASQDQQDRMAEH